MAQKQETEKKRNQKEHLFVDLLQNPEKTQFLGTKRCKTFTQTRNLVLISVKPL